MIHDYFFVKSLDKVRPGGIVAFITSTGTMDKHNPRAREMLAEKADLLGAIRLPNNTFKAAAGTEPGIEAFAQKFLAMFPQYKDSYKEMVAKYGDFLYVEFFKRYGVEKMQELMADETKNKRQLTKYWNMLGDMHYEGELVVGDLICVVILTGAFGKDPAKFDAAADKYLAEYPFLKASAKASVHDYKNNKKLRNILGL